MGASRKIFDFRPSEIAFGAFWGETAGVGRPTANLVIVFKRSHNLKAWLPGKKVSASYCMYSFSSCSVELRDTNTVCRRILSQLLWYSTMVSVGRSYTFAQTY